MPVFSYRRFVDKACPCSHFTHVFSLPRFLCPLTVPSRVIRRPCNGVISLCFHCRANVPRYLCLQWPFGPFSELLFFNFILVLFSEHPHRLQACVIFRDVQIHVASHFKGPRFSFFCQGLYFTGIQVSVRTSENSF